MREQVSIDDVVQFLNSLLKVDPQAISALFDRGRVPCNQALADHPTVQVNEGGVGPLGILNGIFGTYEDGWGPILMVVEDDGTISCFARVRPRSPDESPEDAFDPGEK
jgi:hypothetical protein